MNRRLFVGHILAGASLLGVPSALRAQPVPASSDALSTVNSLKRATDWIRTGALGSLQHITLSHVYTPGYTSLARLQTLLDADLASLSQLLGMELPLTGQGLLERSSTGFGSYWAQLEQQGVTVSWQGLARIGGEATEPTTQLRLWGTKGLVQSHPDGAGYQLIDLQDPTQPRLNQAPSQLNRRSLLSGYHLS
ncbi:hypothetical protein [Fibrella forsythiae]|uniref:Uncharacterized protein n=1 Tax=Fibrella forsythiae TaxID=2817061 RepID=A0ABS3JM26_9BACT|nr:hypothetical protein [Fibrella forsythiae]MBO0951053.1 hypothetical protein [Fibrella forsythiae]